MALSFLSSAAGALSNNSGIIGGIFDLLKGIKGDKAAKSGRNIIVNQPPSQAETRANALYEAILQPNNSLVREQQQEGARLGVEGLLRQIREMQNADRRAVSRGRRGGTFSDPERRDEFLDYSLSRGLPYIEQQALDNARTNIGNTASNIRGFIPAQTQRMKDSIQAQLKYNDYDLNRTGGQYDKIQGGIQDLIRMISAPPTMLRSTPMNNMQWSDFLRRS